MWRARGRNRKEYGVVPTPESQDAIDLKNIREISGGDVALEAQLFKSFLSSSDECLAGLQAAMDKADEALWRRHAHAMKGISLNLGAFPLGELCRKAQENHMADMDEKRTMLTNIEAALADVRRKLNDLISSTM